jgi:hypothetical protein
LYQQLYLGDKKSEQASEIRDYGLQLLLSGKTPADDGILSAWRDKLKKALPDPLDILKPLVSELNLLFFKFSFENFLNHFNL